MALLEDLTTLYRLTEALVAAVDEEDLVRSGALLAERQRPLARLAEAARPTGEAEKRACQELVETLRKTEAELNERLLDHKSALAQKLARLHGTASGIPNGDRLSSEGAAGAAEGLCVNRRV